MRDLDSFEQIKGDYRMLDIVPQRTAGVYKVGPWILYGPAKEQARRSNEMRQHLLIANKKVPPFIKAAFLGVPKEAFKK